MQLVDRETKEVTRLMLDDLFPLSPVALSRVSARFAFSSQLSEQCPSFGVLQMSPMFPTQRKHELLQAGRGGCRRHVRAPHAFTAHKRLTVKPSPQRHPLPSAKASLPPS